MTRATRINKSQIDQWLRIARIQIRKREPALACEAMLSALWLMGVET